MCISNPGTSNGAVVVLDQPLPTFLKNRFESRLRSHNEAYIVTHCFASTLPPSLTSIDRDIPPHSEISNRDRPRYVVPARYSHESDFLRSVGNHRPRSISPGPRLVPSHRIPKRDHREPVPLSGANGIPKAPGRSFPDPITPSQSHEMYINPEASRYSKPLSIPPKLPEPPDYRDIDWRRRTDHPYDRDMSPRDRRPSSWSRQEVCPISPIYSSHRHQLVVRPRSPSPPPRHMPPAMPVSRAPVQHDFYPAERVRPSPVSSRMSLEHRPIHSPEPSDSMRRSAASRYDAYRPSTSFTSESCGARPHDSRRSDAYYPRDPGERLLPVHLNDIDFYLHIY